MPLRERPPKIRFDRAQPGHVAAGVIFAVTLLYVFGFPLLFLLQSLGRGAAPDPTLSPGTLLLALLFNLLVMGVGGVAVLALVAPSREEVWRRLFLAPRAGHARAAAYGLGLTFAALLVYALVLAGLDRLVDLEDNEVVLELGRQLTWPLVVAIALVSSVSEEIYFRALLVPQFGIVFSSLLFGAVHLTYGNWLQVIVPAGLGVVFAWLLLRTRSLAAPLAGHFAWNFLQLAGAMVFADNPDLMAALR